MQSLFFLCISPCVWCFGQAESVLMLMLAAGMTGFAVGLANPFTTLLTALYAGRESMGMGTASGVTSCIYQMGAVLGPWIIGKGIDIAGGFWVAWIMLAAAPVMGALCLAPVREKRNGPRNAMR